MVLLAFTVKDQEEIFPIYFNIFKYFHKIFSVWWLVAYNGSYVQIMQIGHTRLTDIYEET